jgi:hypothetical protein
MNIEIIVVLDNDKELVFNENVVSYTVNERELQIVLSGGSETRIVGFNLDHVPNMKSSKNKILLEIRKEIKMAYFNEIKIGDRVWDFVYGWGEVVSFIDDEDCPIAVKFNNTIESYTLDGRPDKKSNQTLFWNEIKFEIPKKSKIELRENKYIIDLNDDMVSNYPEFIDACLGDYSQENGLFRDDKETAKKALKAIKRFTKLLALRDQECPDSRGYKFRPGKDNWSISYSIKDSKWDFNYVTGQYEPDKVYFATSGDASKICDILNSRIFDLEG